ncbi:MAG: FliA/WhiG family RNA polymerase sigma factor [Bdellovibrionales bacterium]
MSNTSSKNSNNSANNAAGNSSALLRKYKEEPSKLTPQQKDKLIMEYAPLIKFIAQKIAVRLPANIELDDLISSGVIGLMDAIEKYDPSRDNKFKTYAEFRIRGSILDELRAQDWVPRSVRDKSKMLDRALIELESQLGRGATDEEIAERLGVSMDEFHDLLNQVKPVSLLSIDDSATFSNVDKKSILNLLESCKLSNPFNQLNLKSVKDIVATAIEDLPERQRLVLSLYYYEDLNLKEIGRVLRVTESRVSQLHAQAIARLRAKLTQYFEEQELEAV